MATTQRMSWWSQSVTNPLISRKVRAYGSALLASQVRLNALLVIMTTRLCLLFLGFHHVFCSCQ